MKRKNEKKWWNRKCWYVMAGIGGLLAMIQARTVSADLIDSGEMRYSNAPGAPWMETAIIVIVGVMVILAIGAISYLYYQKKQDEQERMQREEAEREEQ